MKQTKADLITQYINDCCDAEDYRAMASSWLQENFTKKELKEMIEDKTKRSDKK